MLSGLSVAHALGWTKAKGYKSPEEFYAADKNPKSFIDREYFLYFINAGPYTKIGLATDPNKRLQEIQVGCPIKIEKFKLFVVGEEDLAFLIERRIHKYFRSKHSSGEWFILNEGDFDKIKRCEELCAWNKADPFTPLTPDEVWVVANNFIDNGMEPIFCT